MEVLEHPKCIMPMNAVKIIGSLSCDFITFWGLIIYKVYYVG
jgi:hypothetical protein